MKTQLISCFLLICCIKAFAQTNFEKLKLQSDAVVTKGEDLAIRSNYKIHGFGKNYDPDIYSPKSATFSKDGRKIYINSLEGCKTVVYDAETHEKLKVIEHKFDSGEGDLWLPSSGYYEFTHYKNGEKKPSAANR